jgi:hypothetical protein
MTLCNTVRQEGVPDEWFKWNLFPYSLAGEVKTWYSFASFEVEGNWNKLTKKFCEKLFPISKVQLSARPLLLNLEEKDLQRTKSLKALQATPLPLVFVPKRPSLWNSARGRQRLPKVFLMQSFKKLQILLSWARKGEEGCEERYCCYCSAHPFSFL